MTQWAFTVRFPFMGETVDVAGVASLGASDEKAARAALIARGVPADQLVDVRRARGTAHQLRNDAAWGAQISRFQDAQRAIKLAVKGWEGA